LTSYLWDGDRAGARYYNVMQTAAGQSEMNSYMANIFAQFHGLEVFGIYESMKGVRNNAGQHFTQTALQAIYNIGRFYVGTRLNKVDNNDGSTVNRTNIGGGWYMVDNVVVKLDYVNQKYEGNAHGSIDGGKFNGLVPEAAISF